MTTPVWIALGLSVLVALKLGALAWYLRAPAEVDDTSPWDKAAGLDQEPSGAAASSPPRPPEVDSSPPPDMPIPGFVGVARSGVKRRVSRRLR